MNKLKISSIFTDAMVLIGVIMWYISTTSFGQQYTSGKYDIGTTVVMIAIFATLLHVIRWIEGNS